MATTDRRALNIQLCPSPLRHRFFLNCRWGWRQDPVEVTAPRANEDLRGVSKPLGLEEREDLGVEQCVARVKAVVTAEITGELNAGDDYFRFFFHGRSFHNCNL